MAQTDTRYSPYPTMIAVFLLLLPVVAVQGTSSQPRHFIASGNRNCTNFTQSIAVSGLNKRYNFSAPTNDQQFTDLNIKQWTSGSTWLEENTAGTAQINGSYNIFLEYCEPVHGATNKSVLQFTHGLSADHKYWDVKIGKDSKYSAVDTAIKSGYATLTYDRLGVGLSEKPNDGLNVVQGGVQTLIAAQITRALKDGSLGVGNHSRVVGVGHSFGSVINVAVAAVEPTLLDGIVLTGFNANATVNRLTVLSLYGGIASKLVPRRFGKLPSGYLLSPSQSTDQYGFFSYPNYTQAAIDLFTATKQTWTLGEIFALPNPLWYGPPVNYTRPLYVITGQRDTIFCEGDCYSNPPSANGVNLTSQLDTAKFLFPAVGSFESYVVPDTGHGISFHETAPLAHDHIVQFLDENHL